MTNRRTNRAGVAIAVFVGVMITASAEAQSPTQPPIMIPLSPAPVDAPSELNLGVGGAGNTRAPRSRVSAYEEPVAVRS